MNEILLVAVIITLVIFYYHCASQRILGAASGYVSGIVYFTLFPIILLIYFMSFPGVEGTYIPGISWIRDADVITVVLEMLILSVGCLTLILRWYPQHGYGRFDKLFRPIQFPISDRLLFAIYIGVATLMFFATGQGSQESHWATGRKDFMAEQGSLGSFLMAIPVAFKFAILFRIMPVLFDHRKMAQNWFILLATVLFDLYTTGARIFAFQFLAVLLFDRLRVRDYRPVGILALIALPIAAGMEVFTVARTHLSRWEEKNVASALEALQTGVSTAGERIQEKEFYERTLVNISEASSLGVLKYVYRSYGTNRPFLAGSTLAKPLIAWIPRMLWQEKPHNFSFIIGSELVGNGVSVGATSLGEFYANFGTLGGLTPPFFLLIYAKLFAMVCRRNSRSFPYILFVFGIAVSRNGLMECAIPMLISLAVMNSLGHSDEEYQNTNGVPQQPQ
ncbi:MAG: hypothetical protein IT422_25490 [Pirellulaceae bacterium]|nr:hypothetical protein [Pirellulaceae bacterium]